MPAVPKKLYGCAGITGFIGTKTEVQSIFSYSNVIGRSHGSGALFEVQLKHIDSEGHPPISLLTTVISHGSTGFVTLTCFPG